MTSVDSAALEAAEAAGCHDEESVDSSEEAAEPFYGGVEEWVGQFFVPVFSRQTNFRWCARWWAHTEAVVTFRALWMSWEGARLENGPSSIATWLAHVAHPLIREVCGPGGAFSACTAERHAEPQPLRTVPVPPGYWPEDDV